MQILAIRASDLLAGPRLMSPGKENDEELVNDVEIGDVEVVLERGHIDIAAKLETQKESVRSK